jgi:DNA-binding NarL/FixJ family response regulator
MRPTDTTPAPAFPNGHPNPAKSVPNYQEWSAVGLCHRSIPSVLLVEERTPSAAALASDLAKATHWQILFAESEDSAAQCISAVRGELKIVIMTISDRGTALRCIRRVRAEAAAARIACPRILVLSSVSQSPDVAFLFKKLGANYLLRSYPIQVIEIVKQIQWELRLKKSLPTIVVHRRDGHVQAVVIRMGPLEKMMKLGPRLRVLIEHLVLYSRDEHTTKMIADTLGICTVSVKEYMFRLRRAFDAALAGQNLGFRGDNVIWTKKRAGGYVHGIKANVEIEDEQP